MALPLYAPTKPVPHEEAGMGTICIRTYGCSHNVSDSEYMAGQLAAYGYALTEDEAQADLLLINSCTVKGPSQDSFLSAVRKASKPLVVAGCVPQADQKHPQLLGLSVIGVQQIDRVVEVVEETLKGNTVRLLGKASRPSLDLPKIRRNRFVEIIPISTGCLGACTYCKTKHARGHLGSYEPQAIVERVKLAAAEGVTQIWLTSEDSGAYGRDIGTSLPQLLEQILADLPAQVMLRIGMTNPPYIREHIVAMAEILNHPQVFSFLHIPVQAGSDAVLHAMRREYTAAEFQDVVDGIKARVPQCTIATDIICGFPTESEEDFAQTLTLVQQNIFPIMNISQFYPRPGTLAARMQRIPTQEVKRRSTMLIELFRSQRPYDALVGTTQPVWFSDRNEDGLLVGHTKSYALVLVAGDDALLGTCRQVRMEHAGKHFVRGIVVD
jgi:threonylcarbamoyladenosine tRNA methylthiotransferase CDKAL1